MSYNLTSAAGLEDIPDSDIEELSQSQSVRSDSDPDYVPPPSSSADELSGSAQSDNEESLFYQHIDAKRPSSSSPHYSISSPCAGCQAVGVLWTRTISTSRQMGPW